MRLFAYFVLVFVCLPAVSEARKKDRNFHLDTTIHTVRPLAYKGFRIISPEFYDPYVPFYFMPKLEERETDPSLAEQIHSLLYQNACKDCHSKDTLYIAIRELRFYDQHMPGYVMSLFLQADFFSGTNGIVRHLYTLDTLYQERKRHGKSAAFFSQSLLHGASVAAGQKITGKKTSLSLEEAGSYYQNALLHLPLYASQKFPVATYKSMDDLLHLRPSDTGLIFEHIPSMEGDGYNSFYRRNTDGTKGEKLSSKDYFAGTDGKDLWLSSWDGYRKVRKVDGEFYFKITAKMATDRTFNPQLGAAGSLLSLAFDEAAGPGGKKERREVWGRFSPFKKYFVPVAGLGYATK